MEYKRKVIEPDELKALFPLDKASIEKKLENDKQIKDIFEGKDNRLLLIIGPCSADREDAVLEYCKKLAKLQEKVKDQIFIIPRIYTNKPRTTGEGYKGMLHQPDPNKKADMVHGIVAVRKLHMSVLQETGFSTADEMLYPENHEYLSDIISYVAVGARSVENQFHRLVSSGVDVPVGMKNPTSGDYSVMMNSVFAAQHPHTFTYRGWEVDTTGNPYTHVILRGSVNKYGITIPNYHYEDIKRVIKMYPSDKYQNPAIVIDCNHSNSGKKFEEQIRIAKEVLHSTRHDEEVFKYVKGLMIESYLVDGNQDVNGGVYGQSITDPCLGWEKTEKLVLELAELRKNENK
ncbi:MAG: 3-deoxy-7-phosphoheptulonate synthase [Acholeplasmatales bacterium]|nr:3-deoxy-7-phosphoheptulonate synthase [Acholeplasmatales bacterium]